MKDRIYMHAWLKAHGRAKQVDTDEAYLELANFLVELFVSDQYGIDSQMDLVLKLTMYMEDCIADGGAWREFIRWHKEKYGRYLPFYELSDDTYFPDEINVEDVAFLLWAYDNPVEDFIVDPLHPGLQDLARVVYGLLERFFEKLPIADADALGKEWVMPREQMEKERRPLPIARPGDKLSADAQRVLEASGGDPLLFLDSYAAGEEFFTNTLGWRLVEDDLDSKTKENTTYVLYANPKGLLVAPSVAPFFAHPRNPTYDPAYARDLGWAVFHAKGLCPFDLLKYAMEHNLLPDVVFPNTTHEETLRENWDFVARWFLGEYYEGD
ncbi:MAG: DUF3843 family protein [Mediterranea sp.]|jgi:hypothetical protein|nr:DUF3843 family protein [Mediterranea sp.]